MGTMFVDDRHILDTAYLIAAFPWDGVEADDGTYNIGVLLSIGDYVERLCLKYNSSIARDTALQEIARLVKAQASVEEDE